MCREVGHGHFQENSAKGSVFVNLRNTGNFKNWPTYCLAELKRGEIADVSLHWWEMENWRNWNRFAPLLREKNKRWVCRSRFSRKSEGGTAQSFPEFVSLLFSAHAPTSVALGTTQGPSRFISFNWET